MKKVVIALLLILPLSSIGGVVGLRAFVRDRARAEARADYYRLMAIERVRAERTRQFMQAPQAQAEAPQEAAAPQRPGRAGQAGRAGAPGPPEGQGIETPQEPQRIEVPEGTRPRISADGREIILEPRDDQFGDFDPELWRRSRNAVRLGQDLTVGPDEVVRDAVVIFGNARIAGRVTGQLAVIFGTAEIERTAIIDGDFITVGGGVTVQPGATARRDVVVVGGPLDAPAGFVAGGQQIVVGSGLLGGSIDALVPYLSRGLLLGRVIVPDLTWIWGVVALVFLIYAALNLMFDRPVRACATTLRSRPLTAFGSGLLVLLLIGPVCLLLAVSVIGIAVIPFLLCALIAGAVIGKVAVARWIGMSAVPEDPEGNRAHAARSFVIGFAVLTIAYIIPVVGIITWAITGVLAIGSATLSFMAAYRRENPAKPPVLVPPPPDTPPSSTFPTTPSPAGAPSAAFDASAAGMPMSPPPFETAAAPPPPAAPVYAAPVGIPAAAASGLLVAQPRALFRDRLAAFIVDVIAVFIAVSFLEAINVVDDEAFFPLLLVYFIVSWTWRQTTIGGIVCQVRLVRTDGAPLTFADALVRALAGIFSLVVVGLGALWILRDPERQAWHDKIAGTYVVKVSRDWPL